MSKVIGGVLSKYRRIFKDDAPLIESTCSQCKENVLITHNQMRLKKSFPKMDIWCFDCLKDYKGEMELKEVSDKDGNYAVNEKDFRG